MAKGPETISKQIKEEADRFEDFIDQKLDGTELRYDNTVIIELPGFPSPLAQEEIKRRYMKAGWQDVVFESSQRDGEWVRLRFSGTK